MGFLFFDEIAPTKKTKNQTVDHADHIELFHSKRCQVCPLNKSEGILNTPKMRARGAKKPLIYILGEAPGQQEDLLGKQFVGDSGQLLRSLLPDEWKNKIRWNNTIRCRPPDNRNPDFQETECCRKFIEEDIAEYQPKAIVTLGKFATSWALNNTDSISSWRGRKVPAKIGGHLCWVFPMFHPSFLLRKGIGTGKKEKSEGDDYSKISGEEILRVFKKDLQNITEHCFSQEFASPQVIPESEYREGITYITGHNDKHDVIKVRKALKRFAKLKKVAIDYETTRLKPYNEDALVLSVAVGTDTDTIVFPLEHPEGWKKARYRRIVMKLWRNFLLDSGSKIAHNAIFEQEWSAVKFGHDTINGPKWIDTQAQAYLLDERKGMLNLDTLSVLHFGFQLKKLSPEINPKKMLSVPYKDLLRYNGLDTKWTFALEKKLSTEIRNRGAVALSKHAFALSSTLALAQIQGINLDWNRVEDFKSAMEKEIDGHLKKIHSLPVIKRFKKERLTNFNPNSPDQVAHVFRVMLERPEVVNTKKNKGFSTDATVLEKLAAKNVKLAKLLLAYKSVEKIKSTYIDKIVSREYIFEDDKIHTSYNSNLTATGRLSASSPNVQNQPKRKWEKIRQIYVAEPGCSFISLDYGQIEARVLAMVSKDVEFCDAIWKGFDIHSFWGNRIVQLEPSIVPKNVDYADKEADSTKKYRKELRGTVKNGLVFPWFYGATMQKGARVLGVTRQTGQILYDEFWETYKGIKAWQDELMARYAVDGYSESITGRRRHEPLSREDAINSPIQGGASDIVTYAQNRLRKMGYIAAINVHDDLSYTSILEENIKNVIKEMLNPKPEGELGSLDWLIVPLSVEAFVGDNWGSQKELGVFSSLDYPEYKHTLKKRYEKALNL